MCGRRSIWTIKRRVSTLPAIELRGSAARVTVRLNRVVIHDNFKLSLRRNKYAAYPEEPLSHIVLQEHGSASAISKYLAA